jgi:hypothetical protein
LKDPSAGEREVARLVADLDADVFAVRESATAALGRLGAAAEPALQRALESDPSAEMKRRARELLDRLPQRAPGVMGGEAVRTVRALRIVEQAGAPAASELLQRLALDGHSRQVRAEARAALERLKVAAR